MVKKKAKSDGPPAATAEADPGPVVDAGYQTTHRVEFGEAGALLVTSDVESGEVRAVSESQGRMFGNWLDADVAAGQERPSLDEVREALEAQLGYGLEPVEDGNYEGEDVLENDPRYQFIFRRATPAADPLDGQEAGCDRGGDIGRVERQRLRVVAAKAAWEAAKKAARAAKADWEEETDELHAVIQAEANPGPLFARAARPQANGHAPAPAADDDSWRDVPLEQALRGLPPGILKKLADKDLTTMGQLSDFTAARGDALTEINGIGPAANAKIGEASDEFWKRWRREQDAKAAEAAPFGEEFPAEGEDGNGGESEGGGGGGE